ncbi:MAG: DUF4190 domain-containing protein [Akkermansiaceae bacterium]|nr:DUF4190 domain-containing protein [Akkermansiaceae bacterium]
MTETPPPGPPSQNNPDIGQHAGYLGLFSMLVIPAPLALITGIIAVKHIRKSQGSENPKHGMGRAIFGILFGAIFTGILIWALIASATS